LPDSKGADCSTSCLQIADHAIEVEDDKLPISQPFASPEEQPRQDYSIVGSEGREFSFSVPFEHVACFLAGLLILRVRSALGSDPAGYTNFLLGRSEP